MNYTPIASRRLWILLPVLALGMGRVIAAETVPVIGCPAESMPDSIEAPANSTASLDVVPSIAAQLAYYRLSSGQRVLAPRGWHCHGDAGSYGTELFVTPDVISSPLRDMPKIPGPAIVLSHFDGDTSGRFTVARFASQLFPGQAREYVSRVKEDMKEVFPDESWNSLRFPLDTYRKVNPTTLEFRTAGSKEGLGTSSSLAKSVNAVAGIVVLHDPEGEPSLTILRVRLPPEARALESTILRAQETEKPD